MTGQDGTVWYLCITEEDLGDVVVLAVAGRVSNQTAGEFGRALARPDIGRRRGVIVDLSEVDYLNSGALKQLEAAAARMQESGCDLILCGLRPVVMAGFELAGSIPYVTFESSREAAVARLGNHITPSGGSTPVVPR